MRKLLVIALASALAGCGTTNHSIGSIQINQQVEALPDDHLEIVRSAVSGRPTIEGAGLTVSQPQTMSGRGGFDPKRWYVCIRGIEPKGSPRSRRIPLQEHIENLASNARNENHYDVVVVFQEGSYRAVVEGFDSRLCKGLAFNRFVAE